MNPLKIFANRLQMMYQVARYGKVYIQPVSRYGFMGYGSYMIGDNEDIVWSKVGAALAGLINHAAYACYTRRSDEFAGMQYRIVDNWTDKTICASNDYNNNDEPVMRALRRFQQKNDGTSLFYLWQLHKSITGEAYIHLRRNGIRTYEFPNGFPADLEFLNSIATNPYAPYGKIERFDYTGSGKAIQLPVDKIVFDHYRTNILTDFMGYSPLMLAIGNNSVNIIKSAGRAALSYFQNDGLPGSLVTPDQTSEVQEWGDTEQEIITKALNRNKGAGSKYQTQIFPYPIKVEVFDLPELQQWTELLAKTEPQIYTAYHVPRSVAGDSDSTRYQASPDDVPNFNRLIVTEAETIQGVMNTNIIPFFYGENPYARFEFDLAKYKQVIEAQARIVAEAYRNGAAKMNEYRRAAGLEDDPNGDVYVIPAGTIIITSEQFAQMVQQPQPALLPAAGEPVLPDPTAPLPDSTQTADPTKDVIEEETGKPLFIALDLANNPDLLALRNSLKEHPQIKQMSGIEWNDPADYHVTLMYVHSLPEEDAPMLIEALKTVEIPEDLFIGIGGVRSFDTLGRHAVHFRVRENTDLRDLQESIAGICADAGAQFQSHYQPEQYTPHVTMAYTQQPARMIPFKGKVTVKPQGLIITYKDEVVYRSDADIQPETVESPAAPTIEPAQPIVETAAPETVEEPTVPAPTETPVLSEPDIEQIITLFDNAMTEAMGQDQPVPPAEETQPEVVDETPPIADVSVPEQPEQPAEAETPDPPSVEAVPEQPEVSEPALDQQTAAEIISIVDQVMSESVLNEDGDKPKARQSDVLAELRAWNHHVKRNRKWRFEPEHIPNDVVQLIRHDIQTSRGDSDSIKSVFSQWRRTLQAREGITDFNKLEDAAYPESVKAVIASLQVLDAEARTITEFARKHYIGILAAKALSTTKARYLSEIEEQFARAIDEKIKRGAFIRRMQVLHDRYGLQIWNDGQADGGVEDYNIADEPDDEQWLRTYVDGQTTFFEGVADQIFADGVVTKDELSGKAEMWFNKTLYPIYLESLNRAGENILAEWRLGNTEEHCDSCKALNGQVRTLKFWKARVQPKDSRLKCKGFKCDCEFKIPAGKKKNRGDLPRWDYS